MSAHRIGPPAAPSAVAIPTPSPKPAPNLRMFAHVRRQRTQPPLRRLVLGRHAVGSRGPEPRTPTSDSVRLGLDC